MKKIFAIMLVMVMCISMVACANTDKEIENSESSTTIEQVEDETAETTEAVESPDNTETTEPAENTEETTAPNENEDVTTSDDIDNDNSNDTNQGTVDNNDSNKEDTKEHNKTEENKTEDNKTENNKDDKEEDKTETEETKPTDDVAGATEDKNDTENTETTEPVEEENEDEVVTPTYTPNQLEQNIFNIINQHRVNAGLPALTFEYSFYSAAKTRATEAATCFSHTRPNGSNYTSVFAETGIKWDFIAGENVGRYFADAETAMNAFMNSQVHKDNILYTGYTRVCIAVVESELYPGYYVIEQLFAGPAGAY